MGANTKNRVDSSPILIFLVFLVLILFLTSPYWTLLGNLPSIPLVSFFTQEENLLDLLWALYHSFLQSILTLISVVVFGSLMSLGLLVFNRRWPFLGSLLGSSLLIPSFLPSLFVLLLFFSTFEAPPLGLGGIVLIQTFILSGLWALSFAHLLEDRALVWFRWCYLGGVGWASAFWKVGGALRREIFSLGLMVFTWAWTSFSIPLVVGGGRGSNLEMLIFEKIRLRGDWRQALLLSLVQMSFIFILSRWGYGWGNPWSPGLGSKSKDGGISNSPPASQLGLEFPWQENWSLLFPLAYFFSFLFAFFYQLGRSLGQVRELFGRLNLTLSHLSSHALYTFGIGMGYFCCLWTLFMVISWPRRPSFILSFLRSYLPPSTALLGLGLILWEGYCGGGGVWLYILGFVILTLPPIYRLGFDQALTRVKPQIEAGRLLGASSGLIFRVLLLPQLGPLAGRLGGIGLFWICGDFALGRLVLRQDLTLGLVVESLMTTYRVEAGWILGGGLLLLSLAMYTMATWSTEYIIRNAKDTLYK